MLDCFAADDLLVDDLRDSEDAAEASAGADAPAPVLDCFAADDLLVDDLRDSEDAAEASAGADAPAPVLDCRSWAMRWRRRCL